MSIQHSTEIYVDSINIFSSREKRNTKNDIETGTREPVRELRWHTIKSLCKQKQESQVLVRCQPPGLPEGEIDGAEEARAIWSRPKGGEDKI